MRAGPRLPPKVAARHLAGAVELARSAAPLAVVGVTVSAVLGGVAPVATAWFTKLVLDRLAGPAGGFGPMVALAVGLTATTVVMAILPNIDKYLDAELDRGVALLMRRRLFAALNRFAGLAPFEDPRFHDRLQLVQQEGHTGPTRLVNGSVAMVQGVIGLVGFLGTLLLLAPWLVLVVLLAALPALYLELRLNRQRAAMLLVIEKYERRDFFYSRLLVSDDAAKEVRLFGLGAFFSRRMLTELGSAHREQRRLDRREAAAQLVLGLLGAAVAGSGLVWAIREAYAGRLTAGDVTVFFAAVPGVQSALGGIISQVGGVHEALLLFDHYKKIVDAESDLRPARVTRPVPPLRSGIELRDVWFRYADDHPWTLRGVDLTIPAGRSVALVGLNGAGKSTLVKLLCRFYDPTEGAIRWDGVDLRDFDVAELRERIGAVFQDFMDYDLSATENIAVGDLSALSDSARIAAAAQRAGIAEKLAGLPKGYDTLLSRIYYDHEDKDNPETGVVLSGGQWQRVALARGLLRDQRDLLILDEPSAGLDAEAEADIHGRIHRLRSGRSSLLISHRLSSVRDADEIAVLGEGRIVERGSHAELLAAGGTYARLFTLQARGYQSESALPR